jgi:anti-anti-sigma factor
VAVVALAGEADLALAAELRAMLGGCAGREVVLVEMSRCTFIDSSVIATLLDAARELRASDSRGLALVAPTKAPARVLEVTGTVDSLPVFPSSDTAISAVGDEPEAA